MSSGCTYNVHATIVLKVNTNIDKAGIYVVHFTRRVFVQLDSRTVICNQNVQHITTQLIAGPCFYIQYYILSKIKANMYSY